MKTLRTAVSTALLCVAAAFICVACTKSKDVIFVEGDIRCSSRGGDDPDSWEGFFGFRVCRSVLK